MLPFHLTSEINCSHCAALTNQKSLIDLNRYFQNINGNTDIHMSNWYPSLNNRFFKKLYELPRQVNTCQIFLLIDRQTNITGNKTNNITKDVYV